MFETRVQLPEPRSNATTIWSVDEHATEIADVPVHAVTTLPKQWRSARGTYILLGGIQPDGTFDAYIGSAFAAGIGSRLPSQVTSRDWVQHAVAIRRTTTGGFSPAQAVFLERTLLAIASSQPTCRPTNAAEPARMPVTAVERRWLRTLLDPMLAVLATHGYHFHASTASDASDGIVTLADLLHAGLLSPGDLLYPRWKPDGISPAVVTRHGDIRWQGRLFDGAMPSVPARLCRGGRKTNGWQYYVIHRGDERIPLEDLRSLYRTHNTTAA